VELVSDDDVTAARGGYVSSNSANLPTGDRVVAEPNWIRKLLAAFGRGSSSRGGDADCEFHWLNKQGVESNRGFVVQHTGRWSMEYREGPHVRVFGVGDNAFFEEINVCPFPTWTGSGDREKRWEIVENIRRALLFEGATPMFVGGPKRYYAPDAKWDPGGCPCTLDELLDL
jgi:hypothetical protein